MQIAIIATVAEMVFIGESDSKVLF